MQNHIPFVVWLKGINVGYARYGQYLDFNLLDVWSTTMYGLCCLDREHQSDDQIDRLDVRAAYYRRKFWVSGSMS